jgi:hypothetical protein
MTHVIEHLTSPNHRIGFIAVVIMCTPRLERLAQPLSSRQIDYVSCRCFVCYDEPMTHLASPLEAAMRALDL